MFGGFLLFIGFGLNIVLYLCPCRRTTLLYSIFSSLFFGLYALLYVSPTGGIICLVQILNTILQIYSPFNKIKNAKFIRLLIALMFALLGTIIFSKTQIDYLPMAAFIVNCFAETSMNKKSIYKLYSLSLLCWLFYALSHGAFVMAFIDLLLLSLNLIVMSELLKLKFFKTVTALASVPIFVKSRLADLML